MSDFSDPNICRYTEDQNGNWEVVCNENFTQSLLKHFNHCGVPAGLSTNQEPKSGYHYIIGTSMMDVRPYLKDWMIANNVGDPQSF